MTSSCSFHFLPNNRGCFHACLANPSQYWFIVVSTSRVLPSTTPLPQGERQTGQPVLLCEAANRTPHSAWRIPGRQHRAFQTLKPKQTIAVTVISSGVCSPQRPTPTVSLLRPLSGTSSLAHIFLSYHILLSRTLFLYPFISS